MGRGRSAKSYAREALDRDSKLPEGERMSASDRIALIKIVGKPPEKRKGNNLPDLRKKPVRNERSISLEAEARIRAIGAKPEPPPTGPAPLDTFLAAIKKSDDENKSDS